MDDPVTFAERVGAEIRKARQRREWTQAHLADACGVTQTAVSYWENGKREPGVSDLYLLASKLGVPVSRLLIDDPRPNDPVQELIRSMRAVATLKPSLRFALIMGDGVNREKSAVLLANCTRSQARIEVALAMTRFAIEDDNKEQQI